MKSYQQFFAELKRRHVFRVAAVYGATGFVLLQAADVLGQGLRLPESFLPFITAVILLGFPLALILAWAFEVTPEGIQRTGGAAPGEIEGLIAEPAWSRWPAGILAFLGIVALVGGVWWIGRSSGTTAGNGPDTTAGTDAAARLTYTSLDDDTRPSIAVLPFADMSPGADQEYFSDGLTEEILNVLAKVRELRVSGRTSAFAYKDRSVDLRQIGDELGVRYIVEGSVRTEGDNLRITAQLIDAEDGSHLWSDSYDRTREGIFAIQSEIAEAVATALRVPLGLGDASRLVSPVEDFEAYDLYLAARARMRERGTSLPEAIRLFRAAVAIDSTWAPAWAGLAEATEIQLWYTRDTATGPSAPDSDASEIADGLRQAEEAARRALALDPRNASAHVALGSVLRDRFEWIESERAYLDALALDPDNAEAHQQYADLLAATGRLAEAVRSAARAAALDPAPVRFSMLGFALYNDDRPDEAILAYKKGIEVDVDDRIRSPETNLGQLYYDTKRFDEAREVFESLEPDGTPAEQSLASWWPEWTSWLRQGSPDAFPDSALRHMDPEDWMLIGEADSAAKYLVEADGVGLELGHLYKVWKPLFDPIRSHPLVQDYLERRRLAGAVIRRTPMVQRELPSVLREAAAPRGDGEP